LDNELYKPEILIQRLTLIVLAIVLAVLVAIFSVHMIRVSDPYVKSVLSISGDPIQGQAIFQMNCAGCHGLQEMEAWDLVCKESRSGSLALV
jgi:hypothetical protein